MTDDHHRCNHLCLFDGFLSVTWQSFSSVDWGCCFVDIIIKTRTSYANIKNLLPVWLPLRWYYFVLKLDSKAFIIRIKFLKDIPISKTSFKLEVNNSSKKFTSFHDVHDDKFLITRTQSYHICSAPYKY